MGDLLQALTPATRALVLACSPSLGSAGAAAKGELKAALSAVEDWRGFSSHIERHRVNSIIAPVLAQLPAGLIPPAITRALSTRAKLQTLKAQHLCDELLRMSQLCVEQGIATLHYKGVTTAIELYGGLHNRPFGDLDFLVHREQADALVNLFQREGYVASIPSAPRARALHYRYRKEIGLRRKGVVFEPHFAFAPASQVFDPGFDALLSRSTTVTVSGDCRSLDLRTPHPEDAVLIYAVAGAILEWRRLPKILDFSRAAARLTLMPDAAQAWARVHAAATGAGWQRALYVSLLLAKDLCRVELPDALYRQASADATAQALAAEVVQVLNKPIQKNRFLPRHHRVFKFFHWRCRERFRDRLRYLFTTTTVPHHSLVQRLPLPHWLTPVYQLAAVCTDYVAYPAARALQILAQKLAQPLRSIKSE